MSVGGLTGHTIPVAYITFTDVAETDRPGVLDVK